MLYWIGSGCHTRSVLARRSCLSLWSAFSGRPCNWEPTMKTKSNNWRFLLSLILTFGVAMSANAAEWKSPLIPVTEDFTLPNGLRVILSEDHSVPVAALVMIYDVGSRNEEKGRSGFAHLFEHMMFEGSENVGKTEHFKYVESAGGSLNASTHNDFTNYYDKLPSNQIELALWLESDRMRSLKVTEENFKNQLETVKEEKRSRIDNQPYTPAALKFEELLFELERGRGVRLVVDPRSLLLLDRLKLVLEVLLRHLERAHAIGFQPERQLNLIRRQLVVIICEVVVGGGVKRAAGAFHVFEVLGLADVLRALEHHVLEQVSETGPAFLLVAGSHVVDDHQCRHRHRVILGEDDTQPVGQREVLGHRDKG